MMVQSSANTSEANGPVLLRPRGASARRLGAGRRYALTLEGFCDVAVRLHEFFPRRLIGSANWISMTGGNGVGIPLVDLWTTRLM
jgi:hypothetical protein